MYRRTSVLIVSGPFVLMPGAMEIGFSRGRRRQAGAVEAVTPANAVLVSMLEFQPSIDAGPGSGARSGRPPGTPLASRR